VGFLGRGEFLDFLRDCQLFKNKEITGTKKPEQEKGHNKTKM
jgi:hypothetical protein